jgi:hypothetical protein
MQMAEEDDDVPRPVMVPEAVAVVERNPLGYQLDLAAMSRGLPPLIWPGVLRQPVAQPMRCGSLPTDEALFRCVVRVQVGRRGDPNVGEVTGLLFGRGYVLTVAHVFGGYDAERTVAIIGRSGSGSTIDTVIFPCPDPSMCVAMDRDLDLAVFYAPPLPVTDFMVLDDFGDKPVGGVFDLYRVNYDQSRYELRVSKQTVTVDSIVLGQHVEGTRRGVTLAVDIEGVIGQCGDPLVRDGRVYGLHSFGWQRAIGFTYTDRKALSVLAQRAVELSRVPWCQLRVIPHSAVKPESISCGLKDMAAYTRAGPNIALLGVVSRRDDMTARWRFTAYNRVFGNSGGLAPAPLRPFVAPCVGGVRAILNPFQNAIVDDVQLNCSVSVAEINEMVADLVGRVYTTDLFRDLTLEEACASYGRVRSIDLARSAGPGFVGNKSAYVARGADGSWVPGEALALAVAVRLRLLQGGLNISGYRGFLKDELRPSSKIATGATRTISVSTFDEYMVLRMFLNPVLDHILKCRAEIGIIVGANAVADAKWFVARARRVSPDLKGWDGDFKFFDRVFSSGIMRIVTCIAYHVARCHGYSPDALSNFWLALSSLVPRCVLIDTMSLWYSSGNPSGCAGTTLWNTLAVVCYLFLAFMRLRPDTTYVFFDCVYPLVYGDDFVAFVAPHVRSWYTPAKVAGVLRKCFSQTMTAADKTELTSDFHDITEMTILKRRFVFNNDLNEWVLALETSSILKSLSMSSAELGVPPEVRDGQALVNAYRELWVHGENTLVSWMGKFEQAASLLPPGTVSFPSIETMRGEFRDGNFTTWDWSPSLR